MLIASSTRRRRLSLGNRIRWHQAGEERSIARVTVGGPGRRFEPLTYSEKWQDEAWMVLAFPEAARDLQHLTLAGNLAEVIAAGDRTHRYFVDPDGNLEYELVFGVKPPSNTVEFQLDFPGQLAFDFQPPLNRGVQDGRWAHVTETEAFAADGRLVTSRPADIVGSYAVYWHKTNQQYQTGKLAHIKRPRFIDARGDWRWGVLEIDRERKRLWITAPERWLAKAVYPVTLDPTIGYTSLGASTDATWKYSFATTQTTASSGDANPGTAFYGGLTDSGTASVYTAAYVYNAAGPAGQARLAASSVITLTTTAGFRSAAITWTGIVASTNYFIVTWSNTDGVNTRYDATGATGFYRATAVASPPNPYPSTGDAGTWNNRTSAYVDFTESGGDILMAQACL